MSGGFDKDWHWRARLHSIRRAAVERRMFTNDANDVDGGREARIRYEAQHARQRHSRRLQKHGRCRLCDARCELWYCDACCWMRLRREEPSGVIPFQGVMPWNGSGDLRATELWVDEIDYDIASAAGVAIVERGRCVLCDQIQSRAHDWNLDDAASRLHSKTVLQPHKGRCKPYPSAVPPKTRRRT